MTDFHAYTSEFIENFAKEKLGVTDPDKLARIVAIYEDWYNQPRWAVHESPDSPHDKADLCFVARVGGTEEEPTNVYAAINRATGQTTLRKQRLHNEKLRSLAPLEVATLIQDENFGYTEDGRGKGEYLHTSCNSIYQESAFKHLTNVAGMAANASVDRLITPIAIIAGHIPEGDDWFSDYKADYDKYDVLRKHVWAVEKRKIRGGFKAFVARLDQDAIKTLFRARMPNHFYYSWLIGRQSCNGPARDDEPVAGEEARRNRRNAAWGFPLLLSAMVYNHELTEMIDRGDNPISAIRNFIAEKTSYYRKPGLDVSAETVKWLAGKKPYLVDGMRCTVNPHIYHMYGDLEWLDALPPEWRPRNADEYAAYATMYYAMDNYAALTGRDKTELYRELAAALNNPGGLPRFLESDAQDGNETANPAKLKSIFRIASPIQAMVRKNGKEDGNLFSMSSNETDFLKRAGEQIILPELCDQLVFSGAPVDALFEANDFVDCNPMNDSPAGNLTRKIFSGLSVLKIKTSSKRWHRNAARLEDRTGFLDKNISWHPVIEPITAPNGVKIDVLSTTQGLRFMAHQMRNCVGGYTYQCAVKSSHVLTLWGPNGEWRTNLELRDFMEGGKRKVSLAQHELPDNVKEVPPQAAEAAKWLIEGINDGSIPCDWKAVDAARAEHRKDALLLKIGFDPLSREARDKAYAAWRGTMPDLFPEADRMEFLERTGLLDAIDNDVTHLLESFVAAPCP